MLTRTETSACNTTALKTDSDLVLSGITVRVDREDSRRYQSLTRKKSYIAICVSYDIGIVKSRGFLLGTGFLLCKKSNKVLRNVFKM